MVSLASGQLPRIVAILMQNGVRPVPISSITVTERLEPRVRAARIIGASHPPRPPAGAPTLVLRLQPWRASARVITVRDPPAGGRRLASRRGCGCCPKSSGGFDPFPADLTQDLGAAAPIGSRPAAVGRVRAPRRAGHGHPPAAGHDGLRRATDDRNDAVRLLAEDDDADDPTAGITVPVPYVIYGGRATATVPFR